MRISAEWDAASPSTFKHVDQHTSVTEKSLGGGITIGVNGVQLIAVGGLTKCYFHASKPGIHGFYYAIRGSKIYIGESKWDVQKRAGAGPAVQEADDGVVYVFSKDGLKRYRGDAIATPTIESNSLGDAKGKLFKVLCEAAEDTYNLLGRPPVVTSVSGGTDGMLTALILREIGADQLCVCVGTSEEDFDPKYAAIYADELGLDYAYLQLPESDEELIWLRDETIRLFEAHDFSNVLMGMCHITIAEAAKADGRHVVYGADLADVVLGNDILSTGSFNKKVREGKLPDTDEAWSAYRIESQLRTLPNNVMITKVFRGRDVHHRQLFYARPVLNFLLSQTRELTPADTDKVLYKAILNDFIKDGIWNHKRKVGFYTGAGIGGIRLKNPILSDHAMADAYKSMKPAKE